LLASIRKFGRSRILDRLGLVACQFHIEDYLHLRAVLQDMINLLLVIPYLFVVNPKPSDMIAKL
jgi:hypothetical protein